MSVRSGRILGMDFFSLFFERYHSVQLASVAEEFSARAKDRDSAALSHLSTNGKPKVRFSPKFISEHIASRPVWKTDQRVQVRLQNYQKRRRTVFQYADDGASR